MTKSLMDKAKHDGGIFEVIRFVLIGGLATLVDLMVTVSLVFFNPHIHENIVTTLAFFTAFWVSYFGHRHITFQKGGSALRFFGLALTMLALRNVIVYFLVMYVMRGLLPLVLAMVVVTAITFVVSKLGIFKEDEDEGHF